MRYLIDFLQDGAIEKTKVYKALGCSAAEAKILRSVMRRYVQGVEESSVLELLQEHFPQKGYRYLKKISVIERLIEKEWLRRSGAEFYDQKNTAKLELLGASVTPSEALLRLLENGTLEETFEDLEPYEDMLEYLQDRFRLIEIKQQLAARRSGFGDIPVSIGRLKHRAERISRRIAARLKLTDARFEVDRIVAEARLDEREETIFFALLKEEYSGGEGQFREMNMLIDLVSEEEYDKIKNRTLLEEGGRLIGQGLVDYEEAVTMFGSHSRLFYIQDGPLERIMHPKKKKRTKITIRALLEGQDLFEYHKPRTTLDEVVLHPATRERLERLVRQVDTGVFKKLKAWGFKDKRKTIDAKIVFYGAPGTGKTLTAMSFAKTLKRPILSLDCSKVLSMYVGESEKNVRRIFDDFKRIRKKTGKEPILLLNEADQFLGMRSQGAGSSVDKMHNQMQNIFLEQIERFEGILIATTNLIENIDKAFSRRFGYKIEFKKPDKAQRLHLWRLMLPKKADYEADFSPERLSEYELTGGQIDVVIRNTAYKVALRKESIFTTQDFIEEIEAERANRFDAQVRLGFDTP